MLCASFLGVRDTAPVAANGSHPGRLYLVVTVSASTTYLPLFCLVVLHYHYVRSKMFSFLGPHGTKCHYFPLNSSGFQMALAVRVQEASGSNPDTPTNYPGTTFVVAGFLIFVGIRKTGPNEVRVANSPVDCLIGRGRILWFLDAPMWVWTEIKFLRF